MVLTLTGRIRLSRQVVYEVIPANHEHFESLAWPCMIVRWHHWRYKHSYVPFFRSLFDRLPVRFSTSDLHHRIPLKRSCELVLKLLEAKEAFCHASVLYVLFWIISPSMQALHNCLFVCSGLLYAWNLKLRTTEQYSCWCNCLFLSNLYQHLLRNEPLDQ